VINVNALAAGWIRVCEERETRTRMQTGGEDVHDHGHECYTNETWESQIRNIYRLRTEQYSEVGSN
jgi:hypothetical protein